MPHLTNCAPPVVAGYQIIRPIGKGGMGVVWEAIQKGTKRKVALKLMNADALGSATSRARFAREVQVAASLSHPNIARVYDAGIHDGSYHYIMEYIDGVPLDRFVERPASGSAANLDAVQAGLPRCAIRP